MRSRNAENVQRVNTGNISIRAIKAQIGKRLDGVYKQHELESMSKKPKVLTFIKSVEQIPPRILKSSLGTSRAETSPDNYSAKASKSKQFTNLQSSKI